MQARDAHTGPQPAITGISLQLTCQYAQQCGLACAIAPQQAPAFAAADGQVDIIKEYLSAVVELQGFEFEKWHGTSVSEQGPAFYGLRAAGASHESPAYSHMTEPGPRSCAGAPYRIARVIEACQASGGFFGGAALGRYALGRELATAGFQVCSNEPLEQLEVLGVAGQQVL